MTYI
ncbi:hypothetical protein D030_2575A, partial [Vibrio parahaemolyticus AQ3810]